MSSTARLRIIQVTDCYTLVNFPSLKTLIQQKRAEMAGTKFNGNAFWVKIYFPWRMITSMQLMKQNSLTYSNVLLNCLTPEMGGTTISMLTGDFLAPYLLSSFDKGLGMMSMLNKTPIDYLTWGNHEHDLDHADVMKREREYKGVWINSNMQSHESFKDSKCQV